MPRIALATLAPFLLLAACKAPRDDATTAADTAAANVDSGCGDEGHLHGMLFGSLEVAVDGAPPGLSCDSMPRPGNQGMRLGFRAEAGSGTLIIIIALPGLERGMTTDGLPANVTLTVEDSGRFFNTPDLEACFVDITQNEPRAGGTYAVGGLLYCVLPLGEVNGDGAVTVQDLHFAGTVDWSER